MLSEFAKVFERKVWDKRASHLHNAIMQGTHFQVQVGVSNCQQILTKISFIILDIVVKNKSNVI